MYGGGKEKCPKKEIFFVVKTFFYQMHLFYSGESNPGLSTHDVAD